MHLHVLLLFLSWLLLAQSNRGTPEISANLSSVVNSSFFIAMPGCNSSCGGVTVPYPFGIGNGCAINSWFQLVCNTSHDPPTLILPDGQPNQFTVFLITQTKISVAGVGIDLCVNESMPNGGVISDWTGTMGLNDGSPYTFSDTANKFTVLGCNADGEISWSDDEGQQFSTGCSSSCSNLSSNFSRDLASESCTGIGCCQVSIPKGITSFNGSLNSTSNSSEILAFDRCISMFLAEESYQINRTLLFNPEGNELINGSVLIKGSIPVALDFVIGNQPCPAQSSVASWCGGNASCNDTNSVNGSGYLCNCNHGYKGNPYLGCTEIDICKSRLGTQCDRKATCHNASPGNYTCKCLSNYVGNGQTCYSILWIELLLGLGFGLFSLLIGVYFIKQRRKLIKLREQFFQQNGGLLMRQKVSSMDGTSAMSSKFFTIEELKQATNNYAENRILGRGGHGVVYKGILPDQRVVAIKKSKVIDESQVEEFINELLILTQVNHRNVVKLLGCCFESEVPQLVYEYIPNGTLFEHIHKTSSWLTLEQRLRIATEAASALSYLHSAASPPIIHRDVKSPNILLDANYMAKVADFGASRLVPLDQTHVATLVQGTLGYLDPEYFHSSKLTEKSDVYSYGVVLAELLTGKKPICLSRSQEERSLATYFIMSMNGKKVFQILEPRLLKEGTLDQLEAFAELVKRCLSLKSEERPSMREVVMELERLRKFKKDPWLSQESHSESEIPRIKEARVDYNTERYSFNCSLTLPR